MPHILLLMGNTNCVEENLQILIWQIDIYINWTADRRMNTQRLWMKITWTSIDPTIIWRSFLESKQQSSPGSIFDPPECLCGWRYCFPRWISSYNSSQIQTLPSDYVPLCSTCEFHYAFELSIGLSWNLHCRSPNGVIQLEMIFPHCIWRPWHFDIYYGFANHFKKIYNLEVKKGEMIVRARTTKSQLVEYPRWFFLSEVF